MAESGPWSQHKERGAGASRIILITAAAHALSSLTRLRLSTPQACLPGVTNQCPYSEVTPPDHSLTQSCRLQHPAMGKQDCVAISPNQAKRYYVVVFFLLDILWTCGMQKNYIYYNNPNFTDRQSL